MIFLNCFFCIADLSNLVTQVDEDGNQINSGPPAESEASSAGSSSKPSSSLCACVIRTLCCINFDDVYNREPLPPLLTEQKPSSKGKKCLVLDLDETLVHSSFVEVPEADFKIDVTLDGRTFIIYVVKRPGVEEFLKDLAEHYEIVLFTASVEKYAQKVTELIDPKATIDAMLFREHCTFHQGNYVKDLARLNRDLTQCIIVDNSEISFQFQPENGIGIGSFLTNKGDRELYYCRDFLLQIKDSVDVRKDLQNYPSFVESRFQQDYAYRLNHRI